MRGWVAVGMLLGSVAIVAGCSDNDATPPSGRTVTTPLTADITVLPNEFNVLAKLVVAQVAADSARVSCWTSTDTVETPFFVIQEGTVRIPVLGLLPRTAYDARLDVYRGATLTSFPVDGWTTDDLPAGLQQVQLRLTGQPGSGYTLVPLPAVNGVASLVAFNANGQIVWYRNAGTDTFYDGKQQPDGNFTAFVSAADGYIEYLPTGDSIRSWRAPPVLQNDEHELMLTGTDSASVRAHFFGSDTRAVDKTPIGGPANATADGHTLLRERADGSIEFSWSAWDHFTIADWIEDPVAWKLQTAGESFDHPNSIDFDLDGNYIVSWRNFAAITKIDYHTGQILWQLGGLNNQFTMVNDPLGGFNGQHSVRVLPNGHLLLYDNGWRHDPAQTRVAEYALDLQQMTATLVWEYRHTPALFTEFVGSVERELNGNTFIAFGSDGILDEVLPNGDVAWEGTLTSTTGAPVGVYRAWRVPSLYRYEHP